jgi:inhibitor of cysteine peptidase
MQSPMLFRTVVMVLLSSVVGLSAWAQSSSSSASSSVSSGGPAEVRVGGLVFEIGSRVAVEIVREGESACFPSVLIERLQVLDDADVVLHKEEFTPAIDAAEWLGRFRLTDAEGAPLEAGGYRIVVTTNVGSFTAEVEIAETSRLYGLGRYSATASVCGLSLRVYRLLTEQDDGAHVTLRVGDRLLVALEGNPTTGYEWANMLFYEFAVLRESREPEYRAESDLVGAGGVFLFRYLAVAADSQSFRYTYQRPWESVQPLEVVEFSVDVR